MGKETSKVILIILIGCSTLIILTGLALLFNLLDQPISNLTTSILHRLPEATWPFRFRQIGAAFLILGSLSLLYFFYLANLSRIIAMDRDFKDWLDQRTSTPPAQADHWPVFTPVDWVIVGFFLVYALLLFLGSIQGNYPDLLLGGDSGNTASFAAGFDHPELFRGDLLLNDSKNILVYSTFNVFFMRLLFPLVKSYTFALAILIPIQAFFQLVGFYLFGRVLFGSRLWGAVLTVLLSISIPINLGETWGLSVDPVARFNFQAFLPFVLCMILIWRAIPARWPWIMLATGIMFYLHPVSTPCWAVAIWLSLFISTPREWKFWKRLGYMTLMGLIFVAVAVPYILTYLGNHVQGKSQNYELVYNTIITYFPENLLDIPAAAAVFTKLIFQNGILPGAVIGLIAVLALRRTHRQPLKIVLTWISGIMLMSILFPLVMHTYERIFRLIPVETEMARAIRYLIPFMLLLIVWGGYEISLRLPVRVVPQAFLNAGVLIVVVGGTLWVGPAQTLQKATACLLQGRLICSELSDYDLLIQAVKTQVPEGAPIYVTFANRSLLSYGMPLRYLAMRPLVYAFKDRGLLVYSNDEALRAWTDIYQQSSKIDRMIGNPTQKLELYLDFAKKLGARYLVADMEDDLRDLTLQSPQAIYRNNRFILIRMN
jgi:hypothetical protein